MADNSFGLKKLEIVGSGTPTIESPDGGNLQITAGITTFSGSVTAASFVKTGGTSSQYLMADGSTSSSASGGSTDLLEIMLFT